MRSCFRAWRSAERRVPAWICVACFAIGCGCAAARPSKYYQLTVPPNAGLAADHHSCSTALLVGSLSASHLYREDEIVYSTGGEQMGTYEYERWAEPPTEMIEDVLVRALRASGRFRSVATLHSDSRGDYVIRGHLYDFKEISGPSMAARVSIELELRDIKSGSVVWTHFYTHDEPVNGKSVSSVVAALDSNVQRGVAEFIAGIGQYCAAHAGPATGEN